MDNLIILGHTGYLGKALMGGLKKIEGYNSILGFSSNDIDLNISDLIITSDEIKFTTNKPNELHIIKVSYFPNWKIDKGLGPYRISPSFMAIVPYESNVLLSFERVNIETYSFYFGLFSLLLSLILFWSLKMKLDYE